MLWFLLAPLVPLLLPLVAPVSAAAQPAVEAQRWRLPVAGAELGAAFSYDRAHPFRAGQRRGIDLRSRPGIVVSSACSGRVTYTGPVPSGGRGVSVRCGRLVATHLGLGRVDVPGGSRVSAGTRLGVVGPQGVVRLGARVADERWGWIDPLPLVDGVRGPPPPLAPFGRAPRAPGAPVWARAPATVRTPAAVRPLAAFPASAFRPVPGPAPGSAPGPVSASVPVPATAPFSALLWFAVALLAIGLGVHGGLWRSRPGRAVRTALGLRRAGGDA